GQANRIVILARTRERGVAHVTVCSCHLLPPLRWKILLALARALAAVLERPEVALGAVLDRHRHRRARISAAAADKSWACRSARRGGRIMRKTFAHLLAGEASAACVPETDLLSGKCISRWAFVFVGADLLEWHFHAPPVRLAAWPRDVGGVLLPPFVPAPGETGEIADATFDMCVGAPVGI